MYIVYLMYTLVFRLGHIIKFTPQFIQLIRSGNIQNVRILSSYVIINALAILFSLRILSRMLSISNLTGIYSTFIFIGLILSLILFTIYNSSFSELNYNIRRYPLPSLRPGKILLYLSLLLSL